MATAPIDSFGVGTDMVTSRDCPALDLTYKLVQVQEKNGTIKYKSKTSPQKKTIPGKKQVFRQYDSKGMLQKDIIGLASEDAPGRRAGVAAAGHPRREIDRSAAFAGERPGDHRGQARAAAFGFQ